MTQMTTCDLHNREINRLKAELAAATQGIVHLHDEIASKSGATVDILGVRYECSVPVAEELAAAKEDAAHEHKRADGYADAWMALMRQSHEWQDRAEKAEAERDALQKQIDEILDDIRC